MAKVEIPTTTARVPVRLVERVNAIAGLRNVSPALVWHELFQATADQALKDAMDTARRALEGEHAPPQPKRRK